MKLLTAERDGNNERGTDALILSNLHLPKSIAKKLFAALPQAVKRSVGLDDLVSSGNLALCQCATRYDALKGAEFKTYASKRLWGAMQDYLREIDPVSITHRRKIKAGDGQDVKIVSEAVLEYSPVFPEDQEFALIERLDAERVGKMFPFLALRYLFGHSDEVLASYIGFHPSRFSQLRASEIESARNIFSDVGPQARKARG